MCVYIDYYIVCDVGEDVVATTFFVVRTYSIARVGPTQGAAHVDTTVTTCAPACDVDDGTDEDIEYMIR